MTIPGSSSRDGLKLVKLLRPYAGSLSIALLAVVGEGITGLLEPWPLKIVFDNVSGSKPLPEWLRRFLPFIGRPDQMGILKLAALSVLTIPVVEALCSYVE